MNNDLQTETIQIKSNKMYRCKKESRVLNRKQVKKDQEGKYFCSHCNAPAEALEDSDTGREILRWL
jgi:predicted SprT family Zn-dependent metalloprotease